jgi:hypothetical protein
MTTAVLPEGVHPTIEVTEPSNGHVVPALVAIILFLAGCVATVLIAGPPL